MVSGVALTTAAAGAGLSLQVFVQSVSDERAHAKQATQTVIEQSRRIDALSRENESLRDALKRTADEAAKISKNDQADQLKSIVVKLTSDINTIEDAIGQNPVKTLALPMLRKDFDALQDKYKADVGLLREDIGRLQSNNLTQMMTLIGFFFSLVILIIGQFWTNRPAVIKKHVTEALADYKGDPPKKD